MRRSRYLTTFSYLGLQRHHLTFCTDERRTIFTSRTAVDLTREQLVRVADEEQFNVLSYCFMPDHLHLLIEGVAERADCRRFVSQLKQQSGFAYARAFRERLWQRYCFEHALRNDEDTLRVARQIVENPIRAGLVDRVEDYPFVGSLVYSLPELLEST